MLNIFSQIYRGAKSLFYGLKEVAFKAFSYFGVEVKAAHFTSEDLSNYQQWIDQHRDLILHIHKQQAMPKYLELAKDADDFDTPNGVYTVDHDNYVHDISHNSKLLRDQVSNIIAQINLFNDTEAKSKGIVANTLGADEAKLTPQKMILQFVQEHLKYVVIDYTDKQHELDRLDLFIKYIQALTAKGSIKKYSNFHLLLLQIDKNLNDARIKLARRVKLNAAKDRLHALTNCINSFVSDTLVFLFNLFNFHSLSGSTEIIDVNYFLPSMQPNKMKIWLQAIKLYRDKHIDFGKLLPDSYFAEIEDALSYNLDKLDKTQELLKDLFLPLRGMLLQSVEPDEEWQKLCNIQNKLIDFVTIHKIFMFLEQKLMTFSVEPGAVSLLQLKKLIDILKIKASELNNGNALSMTADIRSFFVAFRSSTNINLEQVTQATHLENRGLNLQTALTALISKATEVYCDINDNLSLIEQPSLHGDLSDPLSEIINLLGNQQSLRGKSKKIVDNIVKQFLLNLRINGVFPELFLVQLQRFFTLHRDENGLDDITGIREEIDLSADPGFVYYTILVKIFIELIKLDLSAQDKQILLDKFKLFLIEHFLLHDESTIRYLLDVLINQVSQNRELEYQNTSLRILIENHLKFFEQNIHEFIDHNIKILGISITEQEGEEQLSIVTKLEKFIKGIERNLEQQNQFADDVMQKFSETINYSNFEALDKQQILLMSINDYVTSVERLRQILLKSIEFITGLINVYAAFRNNYVQIIQTSSEASDLKLPLSEENIRHISDLQDSLKLLVKQSSSAVKVLSDTSDRLNIAVRDTAQEGLDFIKYKIMDYRARLFNICVFKLKCQVFFGYMQGFDIIFEYAAINYIHNLIITNDLLDESTVQKLIIILNYLDSNKHILSKNLSEFITELVLELNSKNQEREMPVLNLVTTKWGAVALGHDVQELVSNVEQEITTQITVAIQSSDNDNTSVNSGEASNDFAQQQGTQELQELQPRLITVF
jgi:hypothetical protein